MTGQLAAAKMCVLDNEDDLADFTVEIDILSEVRHPNVVELHEAYFIDNKLWVSGTFRDTFMDVHSHKGDKTIRKTFTDILPHQGGNLKNVES